MFIGTSARAKISLRQERNPAGGRLPRQANTIALLRSFGVRKGPPMNISQRWGEATNDVLLHFQLEVAM